MRYLLDTCIVSETNKRMPNANLMRWLAGVATSDLFISVVTIGELRSGARSAKDAELRRKETLKNKCFKAIASPPHDLIYCAA